MDIAYPQNVAPPPPTAPVAKAGTPASNGGLLKSATSFLNKNKWVYAVLLVGLWFLYNKISKSKKGGNNTQAVPVQAVVQVPPAPAAAVDPNFTRLSST
jgi:hypothetical protein